MALRKKSGNLGKFLEPTLPAFDQSLPGISSVPLACLADIGGPLVEVASKGSIVTSPHRPAGRWEAMRGGRGSLVAPPLRTAARPVEHTSSPRFSSRWGPPAGLPGGAAGRLRSNDVRRALTLSSPGSSRAS